MLFVMVTRAMVFFVVSHLLFSVTIQVRPPGLMALPYHLNYMFFIVIIFLKVVALTIVFVVVSRTVDSIVVLSMLLSASALVIPTGPVAPPYHLNYMCIIFIKVVVPIMLFVVVPLVMASIVAFSLLISTAALVLPAGTLAPPYHLKLFFLL